MDKDFLVIGITQPYFFKDEARQINSLLEEKKAHYIHLRKPGSSYGEMENLIQDIKPEFHPFLKLHDHFSLIEKFELGGIHLNSRNPVAFPNAAQISKSIHHPAEIKDTEDLNYFFLSPIFDSISKKGYKAAFNPEELPSFISGKRAIALGGVTPDKFLMLKNLGFYGGALLSYFFPQGNKE